MRLLDVGCGPGSITIGLATVVAPGEAVGVDIQGDVIERARDSARQDEVVNVRFEVGDCYALPFPDQSFDVCFANSVLQHLREPVKALAEMRRVLKPGGMAAVRDMDTECMVFGPDGAVLYAAMALNNRIRRHNGGDPIVGRRYREYFTTAGFSRNTASATAHPSGTQEETRQSARSISTVLRGSTRTAIAEGWITQEEVDEMLAAIEAWGERPDAFAFNVRCNAIGWVD
jgi:ubiquinone/menaquinone biosynthesis C-methylase UbiE